ncbi:lysine--tRNA ligase [Candidatus Dojkabacteria bacterium]|nr:lysine--tRNA ligase [Candidatus Dojkabacteria bacterium]
MDNTQRSDLIGQRNVRIEKVEKMKAMGIDAYPSRSLRSVSNAEIIQNYSKYEGQSVTVAGRLMSFREHGHIVFGHIQDPTEKLQLYIKDDVLAPTDVKGQTIGFADLELFDLGDIVEATGIVTKTQRGEVSVQPVTLRMLTKSIRPLPDKWAGLQDKEAKFRQRYLDLIMDPSKKGKFVDSARILFAIREFLNSKGFLEIKTPVIQPLYGGTNARPFSTYMNALGTDFYLAIAHELYLKRLITAGFENVYNMTGYFRNEGIDRTHNPEFQMLETMTAYKNYEYNMDLTEDLYKHIAKSVMNKNVYKVGGHEINLMGKWERIMMIDAVKKYAGIDFYKINTLPEAHKVLDEIGYEGIKPDNVGESMKVVFEEKVEEQLIQPTIIFGHPVEISPLAKRMADNPKYVERFELFIGGIEQGDNWSELNNPVELFERFKAQSLGKKISENDVAHPMDIEFIETMEYGMPPTTGLGPGIERFQMLFTESEYIDDVIFFPLMRPAPVTKLQKEIYGTDALEGNEKLIGKQKTNKVQDTSKKMVVVLNNALEGWKVTNTVGHICATLGNQIDQDQFASTDSFEFSDGVQIPANSQYPIVALSANEAQLHTLFEKVKEMKEVKYLVYTKEMLEIKNDADISKTTAKMLFKDSEILGLGIFADVETIKETTGKFSLYK